MQNKVSLRKQGNDQFTGKVLQRYCSYAYISRSPGSAGKCAKYVCQKYAKGHEETFYFAHVFGEFALNSRQCREIYDITLAVLHPLGAMFFSVIDMEREFKALPNADRAST